MYRHSTNTLLTRSRSDSNRLGSGANGASRMISSGQNETPSFAAGLIRVRDTAAAVGLARFVILLALDGRGGGGARRAVGLLRSTVSAP